MKQEFDSEDIDSDLATDQMGLHQSGLAEENLGLFIFKRKKDAVQKGQFIQKNSGVRSD